MDDEDCVIKLTPFKRKKANFPLWGSKFEVACNVKGCAEASEANVGSMLPANNIKVLDMSANEGNTFKKRKVQNALAVCSFRLGLDSSTLLKMIKASKSLEWSGGLLCDLVNI